MNTSPSPLLPPTMSTTPTPSPAHHSTPARATSHAGTNAVREKTTTLTEPTAATPTATTTTPTVTRSARTACMTEGRERMKMKEACPTCRLRLLRRVARLEDFQRRRGLRFAPRLDYAVAGIRLARLQQLHMPPNQWRRRVRRKRRGAGRRSQASRRCASGPKREVPRSRRSPTSPPIEDNRRGIRGKEAQLRLAVWSSAIEYAKILYGVYCVDRAAETLDIAISGSSRGGLLRVTARDQTGKFVERCAVPSTGHKRTCFAVGGELCDLDPPVEPSYLS